MHLKCNAASNLIMSKHCDSISYDILSETRHLHEMLLFNGKHFVLHCLQHLFLMQVCAFLKDKCKEVHKIGNNC